MTIWLHNARYVQREKLHFRKDIPTEKPRLGRKTFPDTIEVERLISKKIVKNEVTFFLLHDCCLFLKVKIVKVVAIISFLMPSYVKNKPNCTFILELIFTSVSN